MALGPPGSVLDADDGGRSTIFIVAHVVSSCSQARMLRFTAGKARAGWVDDASSTQALAEQK